MKDYGQLVFLASLFLAGSPIPILVALNFYRRNSKRWETLISFILTLCKLHTTA